MINGASTMIDCQRGFISHLKNAVCRVLTIHSVIHYQYLVAKNKCSKLHDSMQFFIDTINKIKAKLLSYCLFQQLCNNNYENFEAFFYTPKLGGFQK
jgi:hypothetical protein